MEELLNHIKNIKKLIVSDLEINDYMKHKIIESFFSGKLTDVLPPLIYSDVNNFVLQELANEKDKVLIAIKSKTDKPIIFKYCIIPNAIGFVLEFESCSIPDLFADSEISTDCSGNCLLIDFSVLN